MNREEFDDQLLAPVFQWIGLGWQMGELMFCSAEVVRERGVRLMHGVALRGAPDCAEMSLMSHEKVVVPLESAVAMASAVQTHALHFLRRTSEAGRAVTGSAMLLAGSRSLDEFSSRQAGLGGALTSAALNWYGLFGCLADVAEQGLRPVLRQVKANAEALGQR